MGKGKGLSVMKKIGIIGSRRRDCNSAYQACLKAFEEIYEEGDEIVSGGCPKGGDRFAEIIAKKLGIPIKIYYPNWKKNGKAAGFVRNTDIAEDSDVILAVVAEDRTGGTEDTIKKAQKMDKEIFLVEVSEEEKNAEEKKKKELEEIFGD
jgi:predicted Rossmann fold nucleotide-binding protein DprA/Smf involved in DNA uptake